MQMISRAIGPAFALLALAAAPAGAANCTPGWTAAWGSSQMTPDAANALPEGALKDATLRQTVRPSIAGDRVRIRLSNAFGQAPLRISAVSVALAAKSGSAAIRAETRRAVTFAGARWVVIPAGADYLSDPVALPVAALSPLSVSVHFPEAPRGQTAHPGSRTTSHLVAGDQIDAADFVQAKPVEHWFNLSGVEVATCDRPGKSGTIVALGDSITDGRGSTTDGDNRWTDLLAKRLQADPARRGIAIVNQGIGGNRVLLDGLGPNALARFDRDVASLPGVRTLILLEGINDIGNLTREKPVSAAAHDALVAQLTGAYAQIVARARAQGIKAVGATILPFMGTDFYHPDAANEADRQAVNRWIRTPGHFDAVIDFDAAMRDPKRPDTLNPALDSGDKLHPSPAGYQAMADAIPLALFE